MEKRQNKFRMNIHLLLVIHLFHGRRSCKLRRLALMVAHKQSDASASASPDNKGQQASLGLCPIKPCNKPPKTSAHALSLSMSIGHCAGFVGDGGAGFGFGVGGGFGLGVGGVGLGFGGGVDFGGGGHGVYFGGGGGGLGVGQVGQAMDRMKRDSMIDSTRVHFFMFAYSYMKRDSMIDSTRVHFFIYIILFVYSYM